MSDFKWIECSCNKCEVKLQTYSRQQKEIYSKIHQINCDRELAKYLQDKNNGVSCSTTKSLDVIAHKQLSPQKRSLQIHDSEDKKRKKTTTSEFQQNCIRCQCLNCKAKDERIEEMMIELEEFLRRENDDEETNLAFCTEDDKKYTGKKYAFKRYDQFMYLI